MVGLTIIDIYTDGACIGNPGPGGFAAIIDAVNLQYTIAGGERDTTNNRMEIRAALAPLLALDAMPAAHEAEVVVHSDSAYLVNAFNKGWLERWQRNGWKTKTKQRVKNQDLWVEMLGAVSGRSVTFNWIKGHDGHAMNERCDSLSNMQARRAIHMTEPFISSDVPQVHAGAAKRTPAGAPPTLLDW